MMGIKRALLTTKQETQSYLHLPFSPKLYRESIITVKNFDVEFLAEISVLVSPEPKQVVKKMTVCMYVVVWTQV